MKNPLLKISLAILASVVSFNSYADWQCFAVDKGGHAWESKGLTQDHANTVALSFCQAYSPNSSSCHISDCSSSGN